MKVKKRIVIISLFFLFVAAVALFSVAMVFASTEQAMESNITINFKSDNVAGNVNVKYRIGEGTPVDVGTVYFDGSEKTDSQASLDIWEILYIDYNSPYVVFEYTFTNIGQYGFWANFTIDEDLTESNLQDTYSINDSSYGSTKNGIFVNGAKNVGESSTQKYYVKISVVDLLQDTKMTLNFNWKLSVTEKVNNGTSDVVLVSDGSVVTGYSNLKDAITNATAGQTLIINSPYALNLTETLVVNKSLTILPYYDMSITSSSSSYTIQVTNNAIVKLGGEGYGKITITANSTQSDVVYVYSGELILGNVDIIGLAEESASVSTSNVGVMATTSVARAVFISGSAKFTMNDGTIKNFVTNYTNKHGVAIYSFGDVVLNNVQISNCDTNGNGDGVINMDGRAKNIVINNSTISNCSSSYGGAIYTTGNLVLKNSKIENCDSVDIGGAIYISGSEVLIENCEITDCEAKGAKSNGYAGAIYQSGGNVLTIKNSNISNNSSVNHGGAIISLDNCTLNIKSGTFEGNVSQMQGGVVWARNATVNITGGTFKNNTSHAAGGAIRASEISTLNINETDAKVVMERNSALPGSGVVESAGHHGESIYCGEATTVNISGGTFRYHESEYAVYLSTNKESVINANFYENFNAIYNALGNTLTISGNFIGNKQVLYQGGGIVNLNANIDCNKLDGSTQTTDCVIYVTGVRLNINGGCIKNAKSTDKVIHNVATLQINDGLFENNQATNGGVINNNGTLTINGGTFRNNKASNGGVVYTTKKIIFEGGIFVGNTADKGNSIYSTNQIEIAGAEWINLKVDGIELINETAGANLTAIKVNGGSTVNLTDVTISGVGYSTGIENSANLTLEANISNCPKLIKNYGELTIPVE